MWESLVDLQVWIRTQYCLTYSFQRADQRYCSIICSLTRVLKFFIRYRRYYFALVLPPRHRGDDFQQLILDQLQPDTFSKNPNNNWWLPNCRLHYAHLDSCSCVADRYLTLTSIIKPLKKHIKTITRTMKLFGCVWCFIEWTTRCKQIEPICLLTCSTYWRGWLNQIIQYNFLKS